MAGLVEYFVPKKPMVYSRWLSLVIIPMFKTKNSGHVFRVYITSLEHLVAMCIQC